MACRQRNGDGQVMVMDVATVTIMNGMLATRQQWMDCWWRDGDGRLKDNVMATQRQWSNATEMDGTTVMDIVMGDGNGHLVGR
jgi:hypothetical protein